MALVNATGVWDAGALCMTPDFAAGRPEEKTIPPADADVLRRLAERVAELASRPQEAEKRLLWKRHNTLGRTRPLILCDPENGWNEIIPADELLCAEPLARRWEMVLRKEIFWGERLKDDKVIERRFDIGYTHAEDDWGTAETQVGGREGGSYTWVPSVKDPEDAAGLHPPRLEVDRETTRHTAVLAEGLFGDLLVVRTVGVWWWSLGLSFDLARMRGMEQLMLDMVEDPPLVHRLMAIIRDGHLSRLDYLEEQGLLASNSDQYVGSGGFGYTDELPQSPPAGGVSTRDMWGFSESQETIGVSPAMFEEFIFRYQLPILRRFGLNCYGCCEPLDERWPVIKTTPRLRRVSVSPWADMVKMREQLEDRYILSVKPNPAPLALRRLDEDAVRRTIRDALRATKGGHVEIIMKDNHTLGGNPENAVEWVRIAREEVERFPRRE